VVAARIDLRPSLRGRHQHAKIVHDLPLCDERPRSKSNTNSAELSKKRDAICTAIILVEEPAASYTLSSSYILTILSSIYLV
jgi:hypothetical protein